MPPRLIALVPAAGRGDRFGAELPKQFFVIDGRPLLAWTIERLLSGGADVVVVAVPAMLPAGAVPADDRVRAVPGGDSRQASVAACLAASGAQGEDLCLVHDGARPAVHPDDVRAVCAAAVRMGAAVLGRTLVDTLKRVRHGETLEIVETVDRRGLFRAETPQVFAHEILRRAFALAYRDEFQGTDEANLVERLGDVTIAAVEAAHPNPKLTVAADLFLIAGLLGRG